MKKWTLILAAIIFFVFTCRSQAVIVDTVDIYSNAMHTSFKCVVIAPVQEKSYRMPVVYLLHGWSGNYSNWITKVPAIKNYAALHNIIIVCPDGGYSSWYFDSPVDTSMKYDTYIGKEVPAYIDAHYSTIPDRKFRAITGLSMGGHGGLFLAFQHPDIFGACGSISGGVDMNTLHTRFDVIKRLGDTIKYADNWTNYSMMNVVEHYPKDSLAIIIDCGVDDIFYTSNHQLHEKMVKLKIPHDYIERPGKHDWNYWTNSIEYQLLYFSEYFKKNGYH